MLLSRFWYVFLSLALAAAVSGLFIATSLYNRTSKRVNAEALTSDSSLVSWYMRDDARTRASYLVSLAIDANLRAALAKSSGEAKVPGESRDKATSALTKANQTFGETMKFDALWAVDASGRLVGAVGIKHTEDWDLGGYPLVGDALHGWIRDDTWVFKDRVLRVVARPVEQDAGGDPVGAIIGAKVIDDAFARAVSSRTGAAVAFYVGGTRVASGAPEGFDKSSLDLIARDLPEVMANKDYVEKGRSAVRDVDAHLSVVYARLLGEAWDQGAGFAVGRAADAVHGPLDFFSKADDQDKKTTPTALLALIALGLGLAGIIFTVLEHTVPIRTFERETARLGKDLDVLQPSKFRFGFKKIAQDINDGIERISAKGGAPRKAANLEAVLGPMPAQPAMSAFAMADNTPPAADSSPSRPSMPKALPKATPRPPAPGTGGG